MKHKGARIRAGLFLGLYCSFFLFPCLFPVSLASERQVYKIGILAERGKAQCLKQWYHTAVDLSDKIPDSEFSVVPLSAHELSAAVKSRNVDFVIVSPAFYIELEMYYGVQRIATLRNLQGVEWSETLGGVIFTRSGRADINRISDLRDRSFIAVDTGSFGGWFIAWREFKDSGIDPTRDFSKLSFAGTSDAVVYAVKKGEYDAGTVPTNTLESMSKDGKIRLSDFKVLPPASSDDNFSGPEGIMRSSRLYPEWAFAKLRHVSSDLAGKVSIVLLSMASDDISAVTGRYKGWVPPLNYQSVHDCLKDLKIGPYKDFGKVTISDVVRQYWSWMLSLLVLIIVMSVALVRIWFLNRKLAVSEDRLKREVSERRRIDEELKAQRRELQVIIDSVPALIFYKDKSNNMIRVNRAFAELIGLPKDKIEGKSCEELFPGQSEAYLAVDKKVILSGIPSRNVIELLQTSSGMRYVQTDKVPYVNEKGEVIGIVGISVDITDHRRMEEALAEIQRQQQALLDNIPDMAWLKDKDSRFIAVNEAFAKACGFKQDELIGKTDFDIWPRNLAEKYYADDCEVMGSGRRKIVEEPLADREFKISWIETIKTPIYDEKGRITGTTGIARDITERKRVEDSLRKSREYLYKVTDAVPGAVYQYKLEPSGRQSFVFISGGVKNLFGYTAEELQRDFSLAWNEVIAADLDSLKESILASAQTLKPWSHEFRIKHQTGEIRWIHGESLPEPFKSDGSIIWTGTFSDITDHKRDEQALQESERRYRLLADNAVDVICTLDMNLKITYCTPSVFLLLGYSSSEVVNRDIKEFITQSSHEIILTIFSEEVSRVTRDPSMPSLMRMVEVEFLRKDSSQGWIEVKANLLRDDRGLPSGILWVARDITERKKADEELKRAYNQLKDAQTQLVQAEKLASIGQLAAGIAHEINNPVGFINSNLSTLDKYLLAIQELLKAHQDINNALNAGDISRSISLSKDISALRDDLNIDFILSDIASLLSESRNGLERIKKIVVDLKTFAHSDGDVMGTHDLNEIVEGATNIVYNEIKYKAKLEKEYGDIPLVKCNSQQIGQVVINMLINSLQAIQENGVITLRTYLGDNEVRVEIKDNGSGISPENMKKIFDPFFTTKEVGQGTGLGLSISYDIMKKHNGYIDVHSETGKGTVFTLVFPRSK